MHADDVPMDPQNAVCELRPEHTTHYSWDMLDNIHTKLAIDAQLLAEQKGQIRVKKRIINISYRKGIIYPIKTIDYIV
jgi:hypothetical protein